MGQITGRHGHVKTPTGNELMKTLREYLDQLDEISRRDALKYAGATAAGAALGAAGMQQYAKRSDYQSIPEDPQIYFLISYITEYSNHPSSEFGDKLDRIRQTINPLYSQIAADIKSKPNESLDAAIERGYDEAYLSKTALLGRNRQFAGQTPVQRAQQSDAAARSLEPYLKKLEQLLGKKLFQETQDLEESEPEDPIARIDRLFRN